MDFGMANLVAKCISLFDINSLESDDLYHDLCILLNESWYIASTNESSLQSLSKGFILAQAVKNKSWEYMNTGNWCNVPFKIRNIYASACLIKVIILLKKEKSNYSLECLRKALSTIDSALLLGAGMGSQLKEIAKLLSEYIYQEEEKLNNHNLNDMEFSYTEKSSDWIFPGIQGKLVDTLQCPSIEKFSSGYFYQRKPIKLTGCIGHWPALERWKSPAYLLRVSGGRKVPIELGSKYTEDNWGMKLTTLSQFIRNYVVHPDDSSQTGYLAQHPLFDQVSELKEDIFTPEYCCVSDKDEDPSVCINAWFGPRATLSPLHTDPKHNILSQVVGRKRILLYNPLDSPNLYAFQGKLLNNTAEVDPECPNYDKFPLFKEAEAFECHLNPGEMLYIPPKWWHHVRSLDVSFSVSFWWE